MSRSDTCCHHCAVFEHEIRRWESQDKRLLSLEARVTRLTAWIAAAAAGGSAAAQTAFKLLEL